MEGELWLVGAVNIEVDRLTSLVGEGAALPHGTVSDYACVLGENWGVVFGVWQRRMHKKMRTGSPCLSVIAKLCLGATSTRSCC
jgi:hypothetical protein